MQRFCSVCLFASKKESHIDSDASEMFTSNKRLRIAEKNDAPERILIKALQDQLNAQPTLVKRNSVTSREPALPVLTTASTAQSSDFSTTPQAETPKMLSASLEIKGAETHDRDSVVVVEPDEDSIDDVEMLDEEVAKESNQIKAQIEFSAQPQASSMPTPPIAKQFTYPSTASMLARRLSLQHIACPRSPFMRPPCTPRLQTKTERYSACIHD